MTLNNNSNRTESDTMGKIEVANDKYWGAQTQRSLLHFKPSKETLPKELINSLIMIKISAANANRKLNLLDESIVNAIVQAGYEALEGKLDGNFPLSIWQTGSGTQSNMNVNEVLSNRAIEILGGEKGSKSPVHPNDHVNFGQSSNDSFPTAMNISAVLTTHKKLLPTLNDFISLLEKKSEEYKDIIKIGRTHLQDATPITLGQEFSGYTYQIKQAKHRIIFALDELYYLAQGGTAVGNGLNCPSGFVDLFIQELSTITGIPFKSSENKFYSIASHDDLVNFSGALNSLVVAITKIINDIRFLACGPRAGISELILPENEPGSSIMPGKVNPTQVEALSMVCLQVMAFHNAVSMAGMAGQLELNAYKPLIIYNILTSINILENALHGFNEYCLKDLKPNLNNIENLMGKSLMLVTALTHHIGYDKSAHIAKTAHKDEITLLEAAIKLGYCTEEDFHNWVNPKNMI